MSLWVQLFVLYSFFLLFNNCFNKIGLKIVFAALFALILVLEVVSLIEIGEFVNEQFIAHIDRSTLDIAYDYYLSKVLAYLLLYFFILISLCVFGYNKLRYYYIVPILSLLSLVFVSKDSILFKKYVLIDSFFKEQRKPEINNSSHVLNLMEQFISKKDLKATRGKNLVFVYLESIEQGYLDNELFQNLTPNLNQLKKKWSFFNNFHPINGAGWTIVGIYSSQCGIPGDFGVLGNRMFLKYKVSPIICIGDVLNKAGYKQEFMQGASLRFAGKGKFMKAHGYAVVGKNELPKKYKRKDWGVGDYDLFFEAKKKFEKLIQKKDKFNLSLLTVSTHHPKGIYDERCLKYVKPRSDSLEFMVSCVDYLVGDFVKFIETKAPSTLIFIMPDHLAMKSSTTLDKLNKKERKLFLLTNFSKHNDKEINKLITHIDIPRLTLDYLGVTTNAVFLRDLIGSNFSLNYLKQNQSNFIHINKLVNNLD